MKKSKNIPKILPMIAVELICVGCNSNVNTINYKNNTETTNIGIAEITTIDATEQATKASTVVATTQEPSTNVPETTIAEETVAPTEKATEEVTIERKESKKEVKEVVEQKETITDYVDSAQGGVDGYYDQDTAYALLAKVNEIRAEYGLNPLSWDNTLTEVAKVRAKEASICWSHYRPDGSMYTTVCPTRAEGENLAKYYFNVDDVIDAWMNSPGHRENILRSQFTSVGISCYKTSDGGCFWAQSFTTL